MTLSPTYLQKLFTARLLAILSLTAPSVASATQKEQQSPEQLVEKGRELLKVKKYGDARKLFKNALKIKKDFFAANLLLALTYKAEGKEKDAIKYAKEALKNKPNDIDALYLLGVLYHEAKKPDAAQAQVRLAIENGARFSGIYILQAYLELEKNNIEAASIAFEEAIKYTSPTDKGLEMLKQQSEALKTYIKFKEQPSDDADYTKPVPLNTPRPNYTEAARNNREQGAIRLKLFINEQGIVKSWIIQSHLK